MTSAVGAFDDLLRLQELDTATDQLRHRRANLPELAELARIEEALAEVDAAIRRTEPERDEAARQQRHHEDELATTERRIADEERRLYSGAVTVPRELQAMQAEIESLRRLRSSIEDKVLEAMDVREPLDADLERLAGDQRHLDGDAARLRVAIAEAQAGIDGELAVALEARKMAAAGVDGALLTLYDDLRSKLDGVGAARLVNGRCSGCHLSLPAVELDRIRREPDDTLVRCDQCARILVR